MIVVTGSKGLIGHSIFEKALSSGLNVIGLNRGPTFQQSKEKEISTPEVNWPQVIKEITPSAIICCDWDGISASERTNQSLQATNTRRILSNVEAALEAGCKAVFAIGSQAEYGPNERNVKQGEQDTLNPTSFYGKEKVNLYSHLRKLTLESGTVLNWLVAFSLYGSQDSRHSFINEAITQLTSGGNFHVKSPGITWNFLHVSDFADALIKILQSSEDFGRINVAHPESKTLLEYATEIYEVCGRTGHLTRSNCQDLSGFHLNPSIDKLLELGWYPRVPFREGIQSLVRERSN